MGVYTGKQKGSNLNLVTVLKRVCLTGCVYLAKNEVGKLGSSNSTV